MFSGWKSAAALGVLAAALGGCSHDYQDSRPPSDRVDKDNPGIQGFDVITASDKMSADLLALPQLNADRNQWTIVVGNMEDQTSQHGFGHNYDIFLARLKTNLARQSHGRVQLIENRDKFYNLRNKELELPNERDDFKQGGGQAGTPAAPQSVQPDYILHGVARDLPNGRSNYYMMEFDLSNLRNRMIAWNNAYEVTVRQ